ncbi:GH116 family glycosyl hydrolase [Niabella aquatica]
MSNRRSFIKKISISGMATALIPMTPLAKEARTEKEKELMETATAGAAGSRSFNTPYQDEYLNRVAFPLGGIGAGMFCLEGTGAISHMSVRNNPEMFFEPAMFAAICIKGIKNGAKVLEGAVPDWKKFGQRDSGLGGTGGATWGLPRMKAASFTARFPYGALTLKDDDIPLETTINGWSPFIPNDADHSSLPVACLEYTFKNITGRPVEAVFSYNSRNFMAQADALNAIRPIENGFILSSAGTADAPEKQGDFAIFTDEPGTETDHCWFRGGWFDGLTMVWNSIVKGNTVSRPPVEKNAPGASLYVPFRLKAGGEKTIRVMMCWYVPQTRLQIGEVAPSVKEKVKSDVLLQYHKPWYSGRFKSIQEVALYWKDQYEELKQKTKLFSDTFYKTTLPPEVVEAVAANLTILKSPTVLRQYDGRFWCWEGCGDHWGSCHGSCTHVWNYAQAVPHLFPALERSLRDTEFHENQNEEGHQVFRANLPITETVHNFHSACDGQLGGIMKVHRDWHISGNDDWLRNIFPKVKASMAYCIRTWDPQEKGVVEEPHHNTYDIEFWGPTAFGTGFYLGALQAMINMGKYLGEEVLQYESLYNKGRKYIETSLYNGAYFFQDIKWKNLEAPDPAKAQSFHTRYEPEALKLLEAEGPKYQYGLGCLSDGILGAWLSRMCGLKDPVDTGKIKSHLQEVYKHNFKSSLKEHSNPQRPTYALGNEGGLLLCSWPRGGKLSLPFVYSNEVWTGIEYQVAAHLIMMGEIDKGLHIVKACRERYDGRVRNPFNEYECGHWYARALSSYGLLEALTGVRYDAVTKKLYVNSKVGDFTVFLSTATGYGTVEHRQGKTTLQVASGRIDVDSIITGETNR